MMKKHEVAQREHYANQYQKQSLSFGLSNDADLWEWAKWYPLLQLEPFLATLGERSVVTICSGAGREIPTLARRGARVTATDLTVEQLRPLKDKGIIDDCSEQNAERLEYADESFDIGFVNAGLHHLLHPHAGLCELLRVSSQAVLFIESQDSILHSVGKMMGRNADFEPAGNYVYRWNRREIEKIALSAHAHSFAVRTDFMPILMRMRGVTGTRKRLWQMSLKAINVVMAPLGNLLITIIFKRPPDEAQLYALKQCGFGVTDLSGRYPGYVSVPWRATVAPAVDAGDRD